MRIIALDTETTGLSVDKGHRLVEVAAMEIVDRKFTGKQFHTYVNPKRPIDQRAEEVHGISLAFLQDKPVFADVAMEFSEFIQGAEALLIHNAPFDLGFLNHELNLIKNRPKLETTLQIIDTLPMARARHPGQKNNLDALCQRYHIDNSKRDLHGALIDTHLLIKLYLAMTAGQNKLAFTENEQKTKIAPIDPNLKFKIIPADESELQAAAEYFD